jgi:hypothetical protein
VVGQAINDALGRCSYNWEDYRRDGRTCDPHLEAGQWIEQAGADYQAVCHAAGLCPDAVRDAVLNTPNRIGPIYLAGPEIRKRRTARPEGKAA